MGMQGMGGLLGGPQEGLFGPDETKRLQSQGLMNFGASMLANSGPSPEKRSFGQILGNSMLQSQQANAQAQEGQLKNLVLKKQLERPAGENPASVAEYEYAKKNGFLGSFQEWKRVGSAQPQSPSAIQEYEYFNKLDPEGQKQFLSLQRSPVVPQVVMVNGVPTLVNRTNGDKNPLSTLDSEADAARRLKESEARGAAFGKAAGELSAGIVKKGNDAKNVNRLLEGADALIDVATGSTAGDVRDRVSAVFGYAPEAAQATAELQILQAQLMLQQPRMEGPQGVLDVQLYQQMAGEIGNPKVPAAKKKAALRTIRRLQEQYAENAAAELGIPASATPPPKESAADRAKRLGL